MWLTRIGNQNVCRFRVEKNCNTGQILKGNYETSDQNGDRNMDSNNRALADSCGKQYLMINWTRGMCVIF